ncbi:hypothetical protein PESP_b0214 [Pseudoalteromonas espejiana DSM 9414]|uniref:Lipoprotein n=1 Tax=Pseudoalteromonas espejiana TaxID=28107 RepID=A0A510XUN2_9GAMM|nr:DUF5666 domain-containing protein [Pseudoalteromonas espejiana]ASM51814.1 hypothetical protein PESP_b0214 [Pseudoalteromonas espejiana DSM 9414]GEK54709.1 lipoprotein [Pseudoalteromonas espejiana]
MNNSPIKSTVKLISLSAISLALCACGSSSSSSESDAVSNVSNFPSVIIGQVSDVTNSAITINSHTVPASSAEVELDGNNASLSDIKVGMYVEVETNGTQATEIEYDPLLKGPVYIDGDTLSIAGITLNNAQNTNLGEGELLEVSGYSDSTNSITVTYQAAISNAQEELELLGNISNLNTQSGTFNLGNLLINYQQAEVEGALNNGQLVEVEGALNADTVIATEVDAEQNLNFNDDTQAELEGVITFVNNDETLITINSKWQVTVNDQTQFEDGTATNLITGQHVEVDAQWQQNNNQLLATNIEFESSNTEPTETSYTFSVSGQVSVSGNTATINSNNFTLTNQTRYEDGLTAQTLNGQWLELEGTYNNEQTLVSEVEIEDNTSTLDLKGNVTLNENNQAEIWGYVSEDSTLSQFVDQYVGLECQWVNANQVRACALGD